MSGFSPNGRKAPQRVWVCWCASCGYVDYAYTEKPKESGADCPKCGMGREDKRIAGPYELAKRAPRTRRAA